MFHLQQTHFLHREKEKDEELSETERYKYHHDHRKKISAKIIDEVHAILKDTLIENFDNLIHC